MRLLLTNLIILLCISYLSGQTLVDRHSGLLVFPRQASPTENQIEGSPYLDSLFAPGTIYKKKNIVFRNIPLRYNIYEHSIEYKENKTVLKIADPHDLVRVTIGKRVFIYSRYKGSDKLTFSYFEVLNDKKFQLLKMYQMKVTGPNTKDDPRSIHTPTRFELLPASYYLRYHEGVAYRIDSKKQLIKALQPIPARITTDIQAWRINFSNEQQLIELVDYINKSMD